MKKDETVWIIDLFEHLISNYTNGFTGKELNHAIWRFAGFSPDRQRQPFLLGKLKYYLINNGQRFTTNPKRLEQDFGKNYHWSNLDKKNE